jgi:hypothetical protein
MPSVERYTCSMSTGNVTRVLKAYARKQIAVSGSARPMTRRVPSSTTSTAVTPHALSARVSSSI